MTSVFELLRLRLRLQTLTAITAVYISLYERVRVLSGRPIHAVRNNTRGSPFSVRAPRAYNAHACMTT